MSEERTLLSPDPADRDHTIAGYRIIRRLGAGGMGIVYEAEQQSPRRLVALKVIRGGPCVDTQRVKLFEREAQTLARLKHPGIAAIYESGCTEQGEHFFAMELARGEHLDEYLRSRPLPARPSREALRARLMLFLKICEPIFYAHQRGVTHRDLKPGNIKVIPGAEAGPGVSTSALEPQIKILDFGLARITDADVAAVTVVTETGSIAGTLPYMSPEQARGNPDEIDVRSDIYALGVILHEMLTGGLPYRLDQVSLPEAVRLICEAEPARPGTVVRELRGDLETIILKALEKDPGRRYQSVHVLAGDIERYLADQPILARPPSTVYQLRKLVARHKWMVAFAATLLVLLAGFAVVMSVMFTVQHRAKEKAVREALKAERINTFLQEMLASASPSEALGREVTVREILDATAEGVETGLADEPEVQAAVRTTIGNTYIALGLYESAEPQLSAALETRRRVLGPAHAEVAASLDALGTLRYYTGDFNEAGELIRQALAIDRECPAEDDRGLLLHLNNLAAILWAQSRYDEAEPIFREVLDRSRRGFGEKDEDVAVALNNLASLLKNQGRYGEAEPLLREALEIWRGLHGTEHPAVAAVLANLGDLLSSQGKLVEAEPLFREVLAMDRKFVGDEHPDVASDLHNLATLLVKQGRSGDAEPLFREALAIRRETLGNAHPDVAYPLLGLATVLVEDRRAAEAEALLVECLRIRRDHLLPDDWRTALTENVMGRCLAQEKRYAEAETYLLESYPKVLAAEAASSQYKREALAAVIALYEAWGKPERAARYREELNALEK